MLRINSLVRLWCFCYKYTVDILSLCVSDRFYLQGITTYEAVMQYTQDISEYRFSGFSGALKDKFEEVRSVDRNIKWSWPF